MRTPIVGRTYPEESLDFAGCPCFEQGGKQAIVQGPKGGKLGQLHMGRRAGAHGN